MHANFFLLPNSTSVDEEGRPRKYLVKAHCENDLLAREVHNVDTKGTFSFDQPPPHTPGQKREIPVGWQYTVKGPIPDVTSQTQLVFLIKRPKGDAREVDAKRLAPGHVSFKDLASTETQDLIVQPPEPQPGPEEDGAPANNGNTTANLPAPTTEPKKDGAPDDKATPPEPQNNGSPATIWAIPRTKVWCGVHCLSLTTRLYTYIFNYILLRLYIQSSKLTYRLNNFIHPDASEEQKI